MESIYIVSTTKKAEHDRYKVGRHAGSINKLSSRYTTALENPHIYYFRYVDSGTYKDIENSIKRKLEPYRPRNDNGYKLEWVVMKLNDIIDIINETIKDYIDCRDSKNSEDSKDSEDSEDSEFDQKISYLLPNTDNLSLLQEYFIIVKPPSQYKNILNYLNFNADIPLHNNIKCVDKNIVRVHNGNEWISDTTNQVVSDIVDNYKPMLDKIFNRFRIFFTPISMNKFIPKTSVTKTEHQSLKHFLLKKEVQKLSSYERDDTIFDYLAFSFDKVSWYVTKLPEINFDRPLSNIYFDLCKHDKKNTYRKLSNHLEVLIMCEEYGVDLSEERVGIIREFIASYLEKTSNAKCCVSVRKLYDNLRVHNPVFHNQRFLRSYVQLCVTDYDEKLDSLCGYKILNDSKVDVFYEDIKPMDQKPKFVCKTCNITFPRKDNYVRHCNTSAKHNK